MYAPLTQLESRRREVARELQWLSARGRKGRRSPRLPRLVAFLAGMSVKP